MALTALAKYYLVCVCKWLFKNSRFFLEKFANNLANSVSESFSKTHPNPLLLKKSFKKTFVQLIYNTIFIQKFIWDILTQLITSKDVYEKEAQIGSFIWPLVSILKSYSKHKIENGNLEGILINCLQVNSSIFISLSDILCIFSQTNESSDF